VKSGRPDNWTKKVRQGKTQSRWGNRPEEALVSLSSGRRAGEQKKKKIQEGGAEPT